MYRYKLISERVKVEIKEAGLMKEIKNDNH